ncbi:MAG: chemotaxis protein CheA, partial [Kangiellaceae bacterium]
IIEIKDNGGGINHEIIYAKAVEKGLIEDGIEIPEEQIVGLIMEPGFSTAEVVSDVSGRGVGLDVVKRNINNLGGSVDIASELGKGTTFTIRLPLTLAILDGQLVRSANEVYVIPLASIVESIPLTGIKITKIAGDMQVYKNGNEYIPIVDLRNEFEIKTEKQTTNDGLIAIVEGENRKIAIKIDELLGQQQVVIKSLESHYKCIQGVSGATILGDGRVSLILDIVGLSKRASERASQKREQVA